MDLLFGLAFFSVCCIASGIAIFAKRAVWP